MQRNRLATAVFRCERRIAMAIVAGLLRRQLHRASQRNKQYCFPYASDFPPFARQALMCDPLRIRHKEKTPIIYGFGVG